MTHSAEPLRQRLPAQDLRGLSLSSEQPKKLAEWVDALPMINVGESARQVYLTVQEVNRLQTDERTRFQLLEILRPSVHYLSQALSRHYLNQSVMLPEKATRVATLAQSLQNHLATGYKLVTIETLDKLTQQSARKDAELPKLLAEAIHRAISELTGTLLRSSQLYLNTPSKLWLELHHLYLLASDRQLLSSAIADQNNTFSNSSNIEEAYARALLLATCKPNKLRQQEIAQVYQLSEMWAPLVKLERVGVNDDLFVFDLLRDAAPTYRTLAAAAYAESLEVRAINPQQLVDRLKDVLKDPQLGHPKASGEAKLNATLIQHLIRSWSELTARSFQRVAHEGTLELCLGLTATHYFLADRVEFERMISGGKDRFSITDESSPFGKVGNFSRYRDDSGAQKKDVWSLSFNASDTRITAGDDADFNFKSEADSSTDEKEEEATPDLYDRYFCQLINISPGGYCIEWAGEVPPLVKAGELIGIREQDQDNWSLSAIRWVRQIPNHGVQLGIEVLSPRSTPCAAQVIKKTGDATEYMRTLMLPEVKALGQSATLITPNLAFRTGYKVIILQNGEEIKAQLGRQVSTTQSYSQFELTLLSAPTENAAPAAEQAKPKEQEEDFDSIWSTL